eukprot:Rmarinus@m.25321
MENLEAFLEDAAFSPIPDDDPDASTIPSGDDTASRLREELVHVNEKLKAQEKSNEELTKRLAALERVRNAQAPINPPSAPKVNWPKLEAFTGEEPPLNLFLYRLRKEFTQLFGEETPQWPQFALKYLGNAPAVWFKQCEETGNPFVNWGDFCNRIQSAFGTPNEQDQLRDRLEALKYKRGAVSIQQHVNTFREVYTLVKGMGEHDAVRMFLSTLSPQPELQKEVKLQCCQKLEDVFAKAILHDVTSGGSDQQLRASQGGSGAIRGRGKYRNQRRNTWQKFPQHPNDDVAPYKPGQAKMTYGEKRMARASRLCFNCKKPGHFASQCQSPMAQLRAVSCDNVLPNTLPVFSTSSVKQDPATGEFYIPVATRVIESSSLNQST